MQLPQSARNEAFFNCWTRKEAFIKAKGLGLSLPLDQFDVSIGSKQAAVLQTRWDEDEARRWLLLPIKMNLSYVAAVAVEGQHCELKCWDIDEETLKSLIERKMAQSVLIRKRH